MLKNEKRLPDPKGKMKEYIYIYYSSTRNYNNYIRTIMMYTASQTLVVQYFIRLYISYHCSSINYVVIKKRTNYILTVTTESRKILAINYSLNYNKIF